MPPMCGNDKIEIYEFTCMLQECFNGHFTDVGEGTCLDLDQFSVTDRFTVTVH